jgi:hypothetical protein
VDEEIDDAELMRRMESGLVTHRRAVAHLESRLAICRRELHRLQDDISVKKSVIQMLEELMEEVGPLPSPEESAAAEPAPPEPPEGRASRNQRIREAIAAGAKATDQAAIYGVTPARIYQILKTA